MNDLGLVLFLFAFLFCFFFSFLCVIIFDYFAPKIAKMKCDRNFLAHHKGLTASVPEDRSTLIDCVRETQRRATAILTTVLRGGKHCYNIRMIRH